MRDAFARYDMYNRFLGLPFQFDSLIIRNKPNFMDFVDIDIVFYMNRFVVSADEMARVLFFCLALVGAIQLYHLICYV